MKKIKLEKFRIAAPIFDENGRAIGTAVIEISMDIEVKEL